MPEDLKHWAYYADVIGRGWNKGFRLSTTVRKYKLLPKKAVRIARIMKFLSQQPPEKRFVLLQRFFPKKVGLIDLLIFQDYLAGASPAQLCEKYHEDNQYVRGVLRLFGIWRQRIPWIAERIRRSYLLSRSTRTTSEKTGYGVHLVIQALKYKGVPRASRTQKASEMIKANRRAIVKDYKSGMTALQVADKYGVNESTVTKHLKLAGVKIRGFPQKILPSDFKDILRMAKEGMPWQQIADKYDVDKVMIIRIVNRMGFHRPPKGYGFLSTEKELEQLVEESLRMTLYEMALKHNTTVTVIRSRLARAGVLRKKMDEPGKIVPGKMRLPRRGPYLHLETNQALVERVRKLRTTGVSNEAIAKKLGISPHVVQNIIIRYDFPRRPPHRKISAEDAAAMLKLHLAGVHSREIARRMNRVGVYPETVRYILRKQGVDLQRTPWARRFTPEQVAAQNQVIVRFTEKGYGSRPIAAKLGLDHSTVLERRKKLGMGEYGGVSRMTFPSVVWERMARAAGKMYFRGKDLKYVAGRLKVGERIAARLLKDLDKYFNYRVEYYRSSPKGMERVVMPHTMASVRDVLDTKARLGIKPEFVHVRILSKKEMVARTPTSKRLRMLPPESPEAQQLKEQYLKAQTMSDLRRLRKSFHITRLQLGRFIRNMNLPDFRNWHLHPGRKQLLDRVKKHYEAGMHVRAISQVVGVPTPFVKYLLRQEVAR